MTASQGPPGPPHKSRRLAPDELARDLANRLKSAGGSDGGPSRFLPHLDMLNAGRLVMGLGALLLIAGLVAGFTWLSGLAGYETAGLVSETSPVFACPGEPELGKVFEGEAITVIGRSADGVWLVVRDNRAPGNAGYVLHSVVAVEGDESLLSTRECEPTEVQPVAVGQSAPVEESTTTVALISTTTTPGETTTTEATATPNARPRRRTPPSPGTTTTTTTTTTRPGATTTTTRPGATTTTRPTTTTTRASTTTSSNPTSTSSSTTSTSSTTTSSTTTSTSTTIPEETTTTMMETTTTAP